MTPHGQTKGVTNGAMHIIHWQLITFHKDIIFLLRIFVLCVWMPRKLKKELELQTTVGCLMWVLGSELKCAGRAVSSLSG